MYRNQPHLQILAGIAAVFGTVFDILIVFMVALPWLTWDWLKTPIEAALDSATGKQITINGPITGQILLQPAFSPRLTFPDIRIVDPNWKPDPQIGSIAKLVVAIDPGRLLHGALSFPEIDIEQPNFDLVRLPNGKANWDLAPSTSGPSSRSSVPEIGVLTISGGHVRYRDLGKKIDINSTVSNVQAQGHSGAGPLQLAGSGSYQNAPVSIRFTGGPIDMLRDTKTPYNVDVDSQLGRTHFTAKGSITDPLHMTGLNLQLTVDGQNAADLYPYLGVPAPTTPPFHLNGKLDRQGQVWAFESFNGTVGHSDLSGSLRFDTSRPKLFVSGNLTSNNLNFYDTGILVGAPTGSTGTAQQVSTDEKQINQQYSSSNKLLPNSPLNMDEVRKVNVDVTWKAARVTAPNLPLKDVDLRVRINNGVLSLDPLTIGVAGGTIQGAVDIDARTDQVKTNYDLAFRAFQLNEFFGANGSKYLNGVLDARMKLSGVGDTVAKSLGSSNGNISAIIYQGQISNLISDLLSLDVARSLGLLITGDKTIPLRCMITSFAVQNGVMTPQLFVLDTPVTRVSGSGSINLANETLNLQIKGDPKKPALALGGPINVTGTFRHPAVGVGTETVLRGGAAVALGALLSPFASLLALVDPGSAKDVNCAALEHELDQGNTGHLAASPQPSPDANEAAR